jgi:hypothetical protein
MSSESTDFPAYFTRAVLGFPEFFVLPGAHWLLDAIRLARLVIGWLKEAIWVFHVERWYQPRSQGPLKNRGEKTLALAGQIMVWIG